MISAELFDNNASSWSKIGSQIITMENEAFGENSLSNILEKDFLDSTNIVVVLKNENQEAVGFAYAKPSEPETDDGPAKPGETAWMWDTVIKKDYQGKGLLGIIMEKLEGELRKRGFKYLERNALVANDYAQNIVKHYGNRIMKSFPLESKWGPQVFFRIRL